MDTASMDNERESGTSTADLDGRQGPGDPEGLSDHLRRAIGDLQNASLSLPALFRSNDRHAVLESIARDFQVVDNGILTGRDNYQRHRSRQPSSTRR